MSNWRKYGNTEVEQSHRSSPAPQAGINQPGLGVPPPERVTGRDRAFLRSDPDQVGRGRRVGPHTPYGLSGLC